MSALLDRQRDQLWDRRKLPTCVLSMTDPHMMWLSLALSFREYLRISILPPSLIRVSPSESSSVDPLAPQSSISVHAS
jgi:hypothetical protein